MFTGPCLKTAFFGSFSELPFPTIYIIAVRGRATPKNLSREWFYRLLNVLQEEEAADTPSKQVSSISVSEAIPANAQRGVALDGASQAIPKPLKLKASEYTGYTIYSNCVVCMPCFWHVHVAVINALLYSVSQVLCEIMIRLSASCSSILTYIKV